MNNHVDTTIMATAEEGMATAAFLSAAADADVQRGRKRIRRTEGLEARMRYNTRRKQTPSGESGNLRGRSRHRSTSVTARSRSRSFARDRKDSTSPSKTHNILRIVQVSRRGRRRSQSPSRSYTRRDVPPLPLPLSTCRRRRQRTRSRSREHFIREHLHYHHYHAHRPSVETTSVQLKSPLCSEMVVSDHDDGDCGMPNEGPPEID